MRKYLHIAWITLASILIWLVFWKLIGQDLNAFARPILIGIITANVAFSLIISTGLMTLLRFVKKDWLRPFPVFLWVTWLITLITLVLLAALSQN